MAKIKRTERQQELLKEYRREMKVANQRLRELEKLANNPTYDGILNFAYRNAARDVKELGIGDLSKVRYRIPSNTNKLESALKRVQKFNAMPTSKKSTIDKLYTNNASNFNKAFGTNFTVTELKNFTDAVNWEQLKKDKGSEVIQKTIKTVMKYGMKQRDIQVYTKEKGKLTSNQIKKYNELHKIVSNKDDIEIEIARNLQKSGLNFSMLYQGTGDFVPDENNESPFID